MDINMTRALITLLSFTTFIGILVWAWSSRRRSDFEQAERLPFDEDGGERPGGMQ